MPPLAAVARDWAAFAYRAWAGREAEVPASPLPADEMRRLLLGPLLHAGLAAGGDERANWFRDDGRHTLTSNRFRLAQAAAARDAFEHAGIDAVLLKGGACLARFGQRHLDVRPMADLDVLVERHRFHEAARVLTRLGYVPAPAARRWSARLAPAHSFLRTHGAARVEIDLHRGLAQWPLAHELTGAVLAGAERVDGWRVPAPAAAFCLTALHRARHGYRWSCLDLLDIRCLADALDESGWHDVMATAAQCKVQAAVFAAFRQASWWFGPDAADGRRLAALGATLGLVTRRAIDRIAPPAGPFAPDPLWNRPLTRSLLVMPCATGTPLRALLAAASFLPLRMADEARRAGRSGPGPGGRLRRLWKYVLLGADADSTREQGTRA